MRRRLAKLMFYWQAKPVQAISDNAAQALLADALDSERIYYIFHALDTYRRQVEQVQASGHVKPLPSIPTQFDAEALFRLLFHSGPQSILIAGDNQGISTLYATAALPASEIYSITSSKNKSFISGFTKGVPTENVTFIDPSSMHKLASSSFDAIILILPLEEEAAWLEKLLEEKPKLIVVENIRSSNATYAWWQEAAKTCSEYSSYDLFGRGLMLKKDVTSTAYNQAVIFDRHKLW